MYLFFKFNITGNF